MSKDWVTRMPFDIMNLKFILGEYKVKSKVDILNTEDSYIVSSHNIVTEIGNGFLELTGRSMDEPMDNLIGKSLVEIGEMLRINSQILLENIHNYYAGYIFTKFLEPREVNISLFYDKDTNEQIYTFVEKPNSRLDDKLSFVKQTLLDNIVGAAIYSVPDSIMLRVNQNYLDFHDSPFNEETSLGLPISKIITGYVGTESEVVTNTALETGKTSYHREIRLNKFARGITYWDTIRTPIFESGKIKYMLLTTTEATERVLKNQIIEQQNEIIIQQKQELIQQQKELLNRQKNMLDLSTEAIFAWDLNGGIIYWNKGAELMYGYSCEEVIGHISQDLFKTLYPSNIDNIKSILKRDSFWNGEIEHTRKDGKKLLVETRHQVILNELGHKIVIETNHDITGRNWMEEELDKSQRLNTEIIESINDGFFYLSKEWRFIFINNRAANNMGYEPHELLNINIWDKFLHLKGSQIENNFRYVMSERESIQFELSGILTDRYYEYNVYPTSEGISVYWIDITEKKAKEKELIESKEEVMKNRMDKEMARLDKLSLVGAVAAGIGHEVRNPMTTIRGYLQLLGSKQEFSKYNSQFALMIDELDRANSIITEFLSLAKDRVVELKVQSLKEIVEHIFPLIQADGLVTDKYIQMELEEVSEIPLDEKEIRQLILNFVLNGSQAMSPGGTMKIRTFMEEDEIVLSVEDDGKGITPEVLGKIGTPFFTTKENGTGLGLAVCYSIVARHNAKIEIETGTTGTTFFVRFRK
ncbi:PAS domain-containing protein [Desulfosporosinus sp. Sb-LF]|uniref:PAS domain-containing protein n=1 Tax=Desulfosporosinus sp. Sb-LF TaxID=2560027 RepID=UPI0013052D8D|nr:PAS domain-containing protein [Desulfosporosinus sp. Sb-LF]